MPWKKLLVWAAGQIDDALRRKAEFVLEENRVYRALLDRHSPHWHLNDAERKVLAEKGEPLGKLLGEVITIVQPQTLLKWHRQLVASKRDFSRRRKAKPGRVWSNNSSAESRSHHSLLILRRLPLWLPFYEQQHGTLGEPVRRKLLRISLATIDRLLRKGRAHYPGRGLCGTRPRGWLKHQTPMRTDRSGHQNGHQLSTFW